MKIPGRLRLRLRSRGPVAGEDPPVDSPAPDRSRSEDARILRRTRLRLMGVSGLLTLFILVVLGGLVYRFTADTLAADSTGRLSHVADEIANPGAAGRPSVYELTFGGERAGMVGLVVDTSGTAVWGPRTGVPPGLPNRAGVAAALAGRNDVRTTVIASTIPVRVYTTPVHSSTGEIIGVVQTGSDMTEEVHLLNTLLWVLLVGGGAALLASLLAGYFYAGRALVPIRQSIDRREAALQRQREFAANASHELRTPLTVIGASVEDLKRNRRARVEEVGDALSDIDAEVRTMTALVEDMLLLARTDSGVVEIERVPVDLGDIAAEATSMLTTLGQERNVKVVLDPMPAPLTGDPLRLRQLVTILVDNAIRHSPAGATVQVVVRAEPAGVLLAVDDHGPGVKPEDLPRLFERFWRADNAPAGGTGLGLAIACWIVGQHGGEIGAANRPEGGASFWVRLPVGATTAAAGPEAAGPLLGAPGSGAVPDAAPQAAAPQAAAPQAAAPQAAEPPTWTPYSGGPTS
jgi:signal transduction histidine kinase